MSRLRRLLITGKIFFVSCNMTRERPEFKDAEFEILAAIITRVRERRAFPPFRLCLYARSLARTGLSRRWRHATQCYECDQSRRGPRNQPLKEYHESLGYMHLNPVRRGLAKRAEDWSWSSIHAYGGLGRSQLNIDHLSLPADETTRL